MNTAATARLLLHLPTEEDISAWLAENPETCCFSLVLALRDMADTLLTRDLALSLRAATWATLVAARVPPHEYAQAQMESAWAMGSSLCQHGRAEEGLHCYTRALEHAQSLNEPLAQARLMCNIGATHYHLGDYHSARHHIAWARNKLPDDTPPAIRLGIELHYGVVLDYMGDITEALNIYTDAIAIAMTTGVTERAGELICNRAYGLMQQGHLSQAETDFHTARTLMEQHEQHINAARVAMNLGDIYLSQGRLVEAQTMLHQAYAGFQSQGGYLDAAVVQTHQSRLYRTLGLSHEAVALAHKAVATLSEQDWQEERGLSLLELLRAQRQMGQQTQATATIEVAMELWERLGDTLRVAETLGERAMLDIERHNIAAALSDARQAQELFTASGEPRPLWASPARLAEVTALAHLGQYEEAQRAGRALIHDARTIGDHWTLQTALTRLSRLEQTVGAIDTAMDTITQAADDLEQVRQTLTAEELKARFLQHHSLVYDTLVTLTAISDDAPAALDAMMRAKGGGILDMVQRKGTTRMLPPDEQYELENLRRQLAWNRAQHQRSTHRTREEGLKIAEQESRLLDLLRQQQHHTGTTDTLALPDVSTIGSYLPHDGALLEYYLADTTLWGVLLHAQGACSLRMLGTWGNAEQELLEDLDLFFAGVVPTSTAKRDSPSHTSTTDSVHKRLHRLWQLLIAPWGPLPPSLCIAPHSSLGHVPFAALWDGTHYLGAQHTIATFPTGALLAVPPPPPTVQSPSLVLGYTDHGRLPGVQREALLVGQMVPEAQVYTEAQAQSEVLRSLITPPMLLHIAAHAEVRRDAPLFSFIRLSDGDMALESWYDLPLHTTRLVVLSACNTGRIADPGSTLLAFQGALLGAGVQTLVSSLWEANDEATEILMREFYRVWLDGTAPAQALHQAQQALREQPAFSHPAMWASFICGGPGSFRNHK